MKRALFLLVLASCSARSRTPHPVAEWCTPADACWPSAEVWERFGATLDGTLEQPRRTEALASTTNPFEVEDDPAGTLTSGWHGAWESVPSRYAVVAETVDDVVATVEFAREHHVRLVVKATGHDYYGRSTAPDALMLWMHQMREVAVDDAFVPSGCTTAAVPAVRVGAGARWLEVYRAVTVEHGRYAQGGGCTSVGAAGGFLQGGGFGSWSKKYGIAAASLLEAEVVTADGTRVIANACQHEDLFWALRGGGGGTYGVVTRVTLATHELPETFGVVVGAVTAPSDAAYLELIEQFLRFYDEHLDDEHWGEQVKLHADNTLELSLVFQGLSAAEVEAMWAPFRERFAGQLIVLDVPGTKMWDAAYLKQRFGDQAIRLDPRPGQPADQFWWPGDESQVNATIYAYRSRWIPASLFAPDAAAGFAKTLFDASRHWTVSLHFNKGQAGASPEAIARDRETSMNPAVLDAAALAIVAADGRDLAPDEAADAKAHVDAAADLLVAATPGAGTYVNEADYAEADWQHTFWGANYERLLAIKRTYDPDGFFRCHHCVGSE